MIHMAGPFPEEKPKDTEDLLEPGIHGTLRVLKACVKAGSVERVAHTSCLSAICGKKKRNADALKM